MTTQELVQAAAVIASGMAAYTYGKGELSAGNIQQIADMSIQIAREIESFARKSPLPKRAG